MTEARERLDATLATADDATVGTVSGDLLAVSGLLGREAGLARALADPGAAPEARVTLVDALLGARLAATSLDLLGAVVGLRWSSSADLVDAVETLGAQSAFEASSRAGTLEDVEDELFRFSRTIERSSELRTALTDPAVSVDNRTALVGGLLDGKADPTTVALATAVVTSPRGRKPSLALDVLAAEAAARRERKIAVARVAVPMDDDLRERLEAALGATLGHAVRLQVEVDPDLVGGIVVQVGDEVFDGSVARRLGQVSRGLVT
jgi:F-type H+-transporting ATPase subunit delta